MFFLLGVCEYVAIYINLALNDMTDVTLMAAL